MIYNSTRTGNLPDSKRKSKAIPPTTDVRSGNTTVPRGQVSIIPSGKKARRLIEVEGRVRVG